MRHRRGNASSRAGRPRKEGERYPSGQLKSPKPNGRVLGIRQALVGPGGDIANAENPLDVALARGWLSEEQHRSARAYAALYNRAGVALPRGAKVSQLGEGRGEHRDEAVGSAYRPDAQAEGDPGAFDALKAMWAAMSKPQARALLDIAVLETWPPWVLSRCRGIIITTREMVDTVQALQVVTALLDPRVRSRYSRNALLEPVS